MCVGSLDPVVSSVRQMSDDDKCPTSISYQTNYLRLWLRCVIDLRPTSETNVLAEREAAGEGPDMHADGVLRSYMYLGHMPRNTLAVCLQGGERLLQVAPITTGPLRRYLLDPYNADAFAVAICERHERAAAALSGIAHRLKDLHCRG